jgi:hypothetical protein
MAGELFFRQFTDSGSYDVGANSVESGLLVVEVIENADTTPGVLIGGALVVVETQAAVAWASILTSAARGGAPTPTFTVVANRVRVATAGGTGHVIGVRIRRVAMIDFTVRV